MNEQNVENKKLSFEEMCELIKKETNETYQANNSTVKSIQFTKQERRIFNSVAQNAVDLNAYVHKPFFIKMFKNKRKIFNKLYESISLLCDLCIDKLTPYKNLFDFYVISSDAAHNDTVISKEQKKMYDVFKNTDERFCTAFYYLLITRSQLMTEELAYYRNDTIDDVSEFMELVNTLYDKFYEYNKDDLEFLNATLLCCVSCIIENLDE